MSSQPWLLLIVFFLVVGTLSVFTVTALDAPHCLANRGNYTQNSTYAVNLKTLLTSLSSNMNDSGYYKASNGQSPDVAYAMAFCRADIQLSECRSCVHNTSGDITRYCPNQKHAILYRDYCMIRYSNESFFGIRSDSPDTVASSIAVVKLPDRFVDDLRTVLNDLRNETAWGGLPIKVAADNHTAPALQTIYALLQCVPDISPDDCTGCLTAGFDQISDCCYNAQLVKIVAPSCNFQYYVKPFYNATRILEAQRVLSGPEPAVSPMPQEHGRGRVIIIIVVPTVVCLLGIATCVGIYMGKRINKKAKASLSSRRVVDDESSLESLQYDFDKIRVATNDFSDVNKLGSGGFGSVYKGTLQNGQEIAVKRLNPGLGQGDPEFKNEVLLMAKLQHRNLVRLLGFALQGSERLLVYEFIQNASLDHFIFDPVKHSYINWDMRRKIIAGVARGLLYLHEDSRFRIIHRDLKASNILLDGDMNPKISDFGMARLLAQEESGDTTSIIVGTYGYMAPEYAIHGQFSVKLDVFSFGVLVLEVITGQKNSSFRHGEDEEDMLNFVWRNWHQGTTTNIVDPVLRSTSNYLRDMLRYIHVGLLCVQDNPTDRPTMASIVLMLNSLSLTLPVPSQPIFFISCDPDRETSSDIQNSSSREVGMECRETSKKKSTETSPASQNDVSITELCPR